MLNQKICQFIIGMHDTLKTFLCVQYEAACIDISQNLDINLVDLETRFFLIAAFYTT